jgi:hypothetical protein
MANERDIKSEYNERYQEAYREWDGFLREAKKDLRFVVGDQWDSQERDYLRQNRREALSFNKIKRIVNLVSGYQRKNRLGYKVEQLEGSDPKAASQYTALLLHCMEYSNGFHVMSDAFEQGPLKTGIQLVEVSIDYTEDPVSGDVKLNNVPFSRFLLDPNMGKRDLSDCNYILRRDFVTKAQAQMLLPDHAREIERMSPVQHDNKFNFALKSQGADERLRWDEYWRRESEKRTVLVDTQTGAWRWWPKDGDERRLELFRARFPQVVTKEVYKPTIKLAIMVEDQVFYDNIDPLNIGDYPFIPVIGEWNPEHDNHSEKLASLTRGVRDPQKEYNKRRSKILDIIDSQISSGWMAEVDSVINKKDLYQAGQAKVIWAIQDALANQRVQKIQPPQIPAGLFQLEEALNKDIMEIPGANNELLGQADNENERVAGFLAKMRQSQGLTTLQGLFDNYRLSKSLLGQKLLRVIQQSYTPDKVQKILGEPPAQEFYSRDFGKYNVNVVESILTDSQRQMYYNELVSLKQMGAPIPWAAILKAAPIEEREELQQIVAQEEKNAAQQMQQQQRMEQIRTQAELAKMREDVAGALEERTAAQENVANAQLDRVKAMKELEKMDADRLKILADALKTVTGDQGAQGRGTTRQRRMTRR